MRQWITRFAAVLFLVLCASHAAASDWPQFHGPNRDQKSTETGLLASWPAGGPKQLWAFEQLGAGYGSASIVGDRIYVTGEEKGMGHLYCLDRKGKLLWKKPYGPEYDQKRYRGSRTTPTITDGKAYLFSAHGRLACLDATDGKELWAVDTAKTLGARPLRWGINESILIEGDMAVCTPGGSGATFAAFHKDTGKPIWTTPDIGEASGYCSPMATDHGDRRMLISCTATHAVGVDLKDGKLLWKEKRNPKYGIQAVTPIYKDGMVFVTSGYGVGSDMYKLNAAGTASSRAWASKEMDNHHGGVVEVDGFIYGSRDKFRVHPWPVLEWSTGKMVGGAPFVKKGAVLYADGKLIGYGENGQVGLATIDKGALKEVSSFRLKQGDQEHWAHPSLANGVLYIRHGNALVAFQVK